MRVAVYGCFGEWGVEVEDRAFYVVVVDGYDVYASAQHP
jgi:hypothetical protein